MAITAEQRTALLLHIDRLQKSITTLDQTVAITQARRAVAAELLTIFERKLKEGMVQ